MIDDQVASLVSECTVKVFADGTHVGTGFWVSPRHVVTCAHVVRKPTFPIFIEWQGRRLRTTEPRAASGGNAVDLELLEVAMDGEDHPCVFLSDGATVGDQLFIYGHPEACPAGECVTVEYEGFAHHEGATYLKFKAGHIVRGLSGSPILNCRTRAVCGVVANTRGEQAALGGLGVPANDIVQRYPAIGKAQEEYHREVDRWTAARRTVSIEGVEFVKLLGGRFKMGARMTDWGAYEWEWWERDAEVGPFWISRYPITRGQFDRFLKEARSTLSFRTEWAVDGDRAKWPVVAARYEADLFCRWLTRAASRIVPDLSFEGVQLPSEREWEFAARGTGNRRYPWGDDDPDDDRANFGSAVPTPVDRYPNGATPDGIWDLAGNVFERCRETTLTVLPQLSIGGSWFFQNVLRASDHRMPASFSRNTWRVGYLDDMGTFFPSFLEPSPVSRGWISRVRLTAYVITAVVGFRCVFRGFEDH